MKGKYDPSLMDSDVGKLVMAIEDALALVGGRLSNTIEFQESPTVGVGEYTITFQAKFGRDISKSF